ARGAGAAGTQEPRTEAAVRKARRLLLRAEPAVQGGARDAWLRGDGARRTRALGTPTGRGASGEPHRAHRHGRRRPLSRRCRLRRHDAHGTIEAARGNGAVDAARDLPTDRQRRRGLAARGADRRGLAAGLCVRDERANGRGLPGTQRQSVFRADVPRPPARGTPAEGPAARAQGRPFPRLFRERRARRADDRQRPRTARGAGQRLRHCVAGHRQARPRTRAYPWRSSGGLMAPVVVDPDKVRSFKSAKALEDWYRKNHDKADELWLRVYKKGSGVESVTIGEALDAALCWGWIDGIRKS